jgi:hypothetical protein
MPSTIVLPNFLGNNNSVVFGKFPTPSNIEGEAFPPFLPPFDRVIGTNPLTSPNSSPNPGGVPIVIPSSIPTQPGLPIIIPDTAVILGV